MICISWISSFAFRPHNLSKENQSIPPGLLLCGLSACATNETRHDKPDRWECAKVQTTKVVKCERGSPIPFHTELNIVVMYPVYSDHSSTYRKSLINLLLFICIAATMRYGIWCDTAFFYDSHFSCVSFITSYFFFLNFQKNPLHTRPVHREYASE